MAGLTPGPAGLGEPGSDRDRDTSGRATNARKRDDLGRPLPHGVPGHPGEPQHPIAGPDDALDRAQAFFDSGRAFAAHEVLEAAWKQAPPAEREMWQGLAQLAVGQTHLQRGNGTGALRLLQRGSARLADVVPPAPYRIAVPLLLSAAEQAAQWVDAGMPPEQAASRLRWQLRD